MADPKPKASTVSEIMSTPVVTAAGGDTMVETATRMRDGRVGSVVVVDGKRPIGILTERDIMRFAASGSDPSTAKVSEWMTESPDTVAPDEEIVDAFRSLSEHGYRHIPVVSGNELVGIVSIRDLMRVARITPVEAPAVEVPKGLEGVAVAETEIGDVRGTEGFYHYRQYNAVELAENRMLEDVWYLLYNGELPTRAQREAFIDEIRPLREVPSDVKELLPAIAGLGDHFIPLDAMRTALSVMASALDFKPWLDVELAELRTQALQVCAVVPTLIMNLYRLRQGDEPVDPHPDLPYAANFLYMLRGEVPSDDHARAIEHYLVSTIDHGFNASTFTARVIASTGADLGSAVVGAIGALSGPLHGGAPSRALGMLDEIGDPANTDDYLRNAVQSGKRLMGFGHRVYKTDDPRSVMLRGVAERLGGKRVEFAKHVEKRAVAILEELKPGRKLYANVEYYAGLVMDEVGLPGTLFTPTFASSRVIGWTAHILEQAADNRLIRPSARYVGPEPPQPLPEER
ncbi:MAG TPA: citrate synthase [Actinomycetota bacterium]|nr:citrate synthase [Actinomycetota bacterium]